MAETEQPQPAETQEAAAEPEMAQAQAPQIDLTRVVTVGDLRPVVKHIIELTNMMREVGDAVLHIVRTREFKRSVASWGLASAEQVTRIEDRMEAIVGAVNELAAVPRPSQREMHAMERHEEAEEEMPPPPQPAKPVSAGLSGIIGRLGG